MPLRGRRSAGPRRGADEETRAHVAGAASAAAAEVAAPAAVDPDLTGAAFFDVDNTMMMGASLFWFARGLAARKYFTTRDMAGFVWQQAKFRIGGNEGSADDMHTIRENALAFVAGPAGRRDRAGQRGDLRRADGRPDLGRHAGARPAAPRRRPAGLAGHRDAGRAGRDHRPPARADRRARHGRRGGRREVHRPAGRRADARPGEGGGGAGARRARGAGPVPLHRLQRLGQRPADAVAHRHRRRGQPRHRAARRSPARGAGRSATSAPAARRRRSASRRSPPRRSPAAWSAARSRCAGATSSPGEPRTLCAGAARLRPNSCASAHTVEADLSRRRSCAAGAAGRASAGWSRAPGRSG